MHQRVHSSLLWSAQKQLNIIKGANVHLSISLQGHRRKHHNGLMFTAVHAQWAVCAAGAFWDISITLSDQ